MHFRSIDVIYIFGGLHLCNFGVKTVITELLRGERDL